MLNIHYFCTNQMKRILLILLLSTSFSSLKAQNEDNPLAIYAGGGYPIPFFDWNTKVNLYGDIGLKYYFGGGLSATVAFTDYWFYQAKQPTGFIRRLNTQLYGFEFGGMYELPIGNNWHIGAALAFSLNQFKTSSVFGTVGGADSVTTEYVRPVSKPILNYKTALVLRKEFGVFDIQFQGMYNIPESYYMDNWPASKKRDAYSVIYIGLIYKFGASPQMRGPVLRKSRKQGCPTF